MAQFLFETDKVEDMPFAFAMSAFKQFETFNPSLENNTAVLELYWKAGNCYALASYLAVTKELVLTQFYRRALL